MLSGYGFSWIRLLAAVVAVIWACSALSAQEPEADAAQKVQDRVRSILQNLQEKADKQREFDRRDALVLLRNARAAEQAGNLAEALRLAQQAERLWPDSPEVLEMVRSLLRRQESQRRHSVTLLVITRRIEEALEHVESLRRKGQGEQAADLAEAVRQTLAELPASPALEEVRKSARLLETEPANPSSTHKSKTAQEPIENDEDIPPPVRIDLPPAKVPEKTAETKPPAPTKAQELSSLSEADLCKALNQRVSLVWVALPLPEALRELSRVTGVPIVLDPILERSGLGPLVLVNLRVGEATVERVLRMLGELTGGAYFLSRGQVVFTTKARALEYVLSGRDGGISLMAPTNAPGRPRVSAPSRAALSRSEPEPPEYLRSGKAFREHIRDLLDHQGSENP